MCAYTAQAAHYTLPLLVSPGGSGQPEGVVRILNGTEESGTVEIYAIDDAGTRSGPVTFTLNASAAVEYTASGLRDCSNTQQGRSGCLDPQVGDARLEIETDLDIVPLAFVRAPDGTLSPMHDTVRGEAGDESGGYTYEVPVFNPSTDLTQVSRLRLINPGDAAASVAIGGRDDSGAPATGGEVTLTLPAGGAKTLTAQQIEAGDAGLTGRLGAGVGKWRLTVSSDRPLEVVNIVASSTGYWNNLSTTAVAGAAPVDRDAFAARFLDTGIGLRTDSGYTTFTAVDVDRFTETGESDGAAVSFTGRYAYEAIGPDAGRLTVSYDDGRQCGRNLYFATLDGGWFAAFCTAADDPSGFWVAGDWSVADDADGGRGGNGPVSNTYVVGHALPGVPESGRFMPAALSGGSVSTAGESTTISLEEGGYFGLSDGTIYTCTSAGGCAIANGAVTLGAVTRTAMSSGAIDRFPTFRNSTHPDDRTYTVGTAIDTLTLPEASGGNGTLSYGLSPIVPGLVFDAATRELSGTPGTPGTYAMIYTVVDEDGDADSLGFTVTVSDAPPGAGLLGVCRVGMSLSTGQSCTYPDTADEFSVNVRGRGSFLDRLAGIRIRIDNQTINGRVYDLLATHLGDGVWRIDRVAGSTEPGTVGAMGGSVPRFDEGAGPGGLTYTVGTAIDALSLPEASGGAGTLKYGLSPRVPGLMFDAATRELAGTPSVAGVYDMTYTAIDADGHADSLTFAIAVENVRAAGDFGLESVNGQPRAIDFANKRFHVLDSGEGKLYAYAASGERDSAADLDLDQDNADPSGAAFANGRFHVVDSIDDKVYAYTLSGERESAADFDLDEDNADPSGIALANGRFHVVDLLDDKVYAYTASGERESAADFDLDEENGDPSGIAFANGRFHLVDAGVGKVYAYTASGQRESAVDFDLDEDNGDPSGIAFANGRFHVVDLVDDKVYAYTVSGARAAAGDYGVGDADLAVASPTVSDSEPSAGGSFTLSATVRNDGGAEAPVTTLRFYRSTDSIIGTGDTEVGTNEVNRLAAFGTGSQSIRLSAPFSAGTYYYGACVDAVANESDTANNCSSAVSVSVTGGGGTTTPTATPRPSTPPHPQNRRLTKDDSGNVRVSWDASPGATHYDIWRCHTAPAHCMWRSYWYKVASGITETTWLDTTVGSVPPYRGLPDPYLEYGVEPCNSVGCTSMFIPHPGVRSASDPYTEMRTPPIPRTRVQQ